MEPHCSFKASKNLLKNINCHHHNANDRFGLKTSLLRANGGVAVLATPLRYAVVGC